MSLKEYLYQKCKAHEGVITYNDMSVWSQECGQRAETGARRMRELTEAGTLKREPGKYVSWRMAGKTNYLVDRVNKHFEEKENNKPNTLF